MLEDGHRMLVVNRRPGLRSGTTIADMATDYAAMITAEFHGPVDIIGVSTGGSIALRFAIDHPALVRRLVMTLPIRGLAWLIGTVSFRNIDPSDVVITIEAEDAFDVGDSLGAIQAPTLVGGGARDALYSPAIFTATADRIPNARLVLEPDAGHVPTTPRVKQEILDFLGPG